MSNQHKITYLELPTTDIEKTKAFFTQIFDWKFEDYGSDYTVFIGAGINGGFFKSDKKVSTEDGSVLVVLYSEALESTQSKIEQAGGTIVRPIFSFPGGRRFHFTGPSGNEYGVWSDT
ncbi:VOC family protein [cf. Phormidesmis sp. LEGE 11477]|uniref:VOC family protein n=1 Tax=cf. Phormidesmis sp. LEGE 11477 TaxID=1828680 RepID=UPI001882BC82|nr:VOC family protein [cf. Phormidesmis sp. LEGE 11477]MBE9059533.1 VOC family protein [cf. Phormidesmis sp. LEGE 11477]